MKKYRDLAIFVFISLGLTIVIAGSLFNYYLSPVSHDTIDQSIQITDGKNVAKIAKMLYNKKLIRNPKVFKIYLDINNIKQLKNGLFKLNSNMSSKEIARRLSGIEQ